MNTNEDVKINRKHKDRLFRLLFSETNKDNLLELYNAVNHSEYLDVGELEVVTLQDVIYMRMKNDSAFIIGNMLNLYEHQSTFNPNMPLRGLLYFADVYRGLIEGNEWNIYGSKLVKLPVPSYIVFYNGDAEKDSVMKLRLSEAFEEVKHSNGLSGGKDEYEWTATMININYGRNEGLINRSSTLYQYCRFVSEVKHNIKIMPAFEAIDKAVKQCIEEGILAEFLIKHRSEVVDSMLTEYDEEKVLKQIGKDSYDDGYKAGKDDGYDTGKNDGINQGIAHSILKVLNTKGFLDTDINDLILSVEDETVLDKILDIALVSKDIDEFMGSVKNLF